MKKLNLKDFQSLKEFELNVVKITSLITRISGGIYVLDALNSRTKLKEVQLDTETQDALETFKIKDKEIEKIFEIGFIALFSTFEFFMFDFLKELYFKFPKSFPKDAKINFEELSNLTSVKQMKEYIVDKTAIQKTYDVEKWTELLQTQYSIKVFPTKQSREDMTILNELRNAFMHSGGKINSKFKNMLIKQLKLKPNKIKLGDNITVDREKFYEALKDHFEIDIIESLKKL